MKKVLVFVFFVFCFGGVLGAELHVGSGQTYSTIQSAVNVAGAGDVVYVHGGTYNERVSIANSGASGNFITVTGYPGDTMPVVRQFSINGASYVRIIGFEITHVDNNVDGAILATGDTSHVEILDNYIHNIRGHHYTGVGSAIRDSGAATYWVIRGNTFYYMGYIPGVFDGDNNAVISGNWPNSGTGHWLVEYNDASRSMDYFYLFGMHNVIRNNYVHDTDPIYWSGITGGEEGFHIDIFQSASDGGQSYHRYNVYESNFFSDFSNYYHCHGALEQDNTGYGDTDVIMRGNVFSNMCGGALGGFNVNYVSMYHNTFYEMNQNGNQGPTITMYARAGESPDYTVLMNNLLSEDGSNNPLQLDDYPVPGTVSECNLGYNSGSDASYISTSNPLLANPSSHDLTLSSASSPAYNTGCPIAEVVSSSGGGVTFNVAANIANRFTDGYGIVEGDLIRVGSNSPVRITSISGTSITVDQSISWNNGDGIYWQVQDAYSDIGAYPYRASGYSVTNNLNYNDGDFVPQETVLLEASVNDDELVRFVEFWVDGLPVGIDYEAPYEYSWDASGEELGSSHFVEVVARPLYADDVLGYADSAEVSVGASVPCSDGAARSCITGLLGVCSDGTQICSSGSWGGCVSNVTAGLEVCSGGLDEDCDGAIDCLDSDCSLSLECQAADTCSDLGGVDCCEGTLICLGTSYSGSSDCGGVCCSEACSVPSVGSNLCSDQTMVLNSENFDVEHLVEHLWDGCLEGTSVCSAGAQYEDYFWVEFDFGDVYFLSEARLFGDADGTWVTGDWGLEYKVNSGDIWVSAFSGVDAFFNNWSSRSLGVDARFVRVNVSSATGSIQARELEIFGSLALGCSHEADLSNPCDGVSFDEVVAYIDRWVIGDVSLNDLIGAVNAWKGM